MNQLIQKLYQLVPLTENEIEHLFDQMLLGDMDDVTMSAILMSLKHQKIQASHIKGAAKALLHAAQKIDIPDNEYCVDCCGTGGDGKGLLNISTTVSFIAAACGLKVIKHGNRAVSSQSGSADVLEELGIPLIESEQFLKQQLQQTGLTFLFAPFFHPALKHVMPVRKMLATRTIFNVLGPIINPAEPGFQLMGVYHPDLCRPVAETLQSLGRKHALVVHGSGLDEIAIHGSTQFAEVKSGEITEGVLELDQLGIKPFSLQSIQGKDPAYNARKIKNLLSGKGDQAFVEAVAINCGALLYCADRVSDIESGYLQAKMKIESGEGEILRQKLENLCQKHLSEVAK